MLFRHHKQVTGCLLSIPELLQAAHGCGGLSSCFDNDVVTDVIHTLSRGSFINLSGVPSLPSPPLPPLPPLTMSHDQQRTPDLLPPSGHRLTRAPRADRHFRRRDVGRPGRARRDPRARGGDRDDGGHRARGVRRARGCVRPAGHGGRPGGGHVVFGRPPGHGRRAARLSASAQNVQQIRSVRTSQINRLSCALQYLEGLSLDHTL
jgi:hypothetical protein